MPIGRKVLTRYNPKPIPLRQFDWEATYDDWEEGSPIGFGKTEEEARRDLEAEEEWRREWQDKEDGPTEHNPNGY